MENISDVTNLRELTTNKQTQSMSLFLSDSLGRADAFVCIGRMKGQSNSEGDEAISKKERSLELSEVRWTE